MLTSEIEDYERHTQKDEADSNNYENYHPDEQEANDSDIKVKIEDGEKENDDTMNLLETSGATDNKAGDYVLGEEVADEDEGLKETIKPNKKKLLKKLYCNLCDFKAKRKQHLKQHMDTEHKGVIRKCDHCEYETKHWDHLNRHVRAEHEGITYTLSLIHI